ncbi:hypothetical protein D3C81_1954820 [compost metagenome]
MHIGVPVCRLRDLADGDLVDYLVGAIQFAQAHQHRRLGRFVRHRAAGEYLARLRRGGGRYRDSGCRRGGVLRIGAGQRACEAEK